MGNRSVSVAPVAKDHLSSKLTKVTALQGKLASKVAQSESRLAALDKRSGKLKKYKNLSKTTSELGSKLKLAQSRTKSLSKDLRNTEKPSAALTKRFEASRREVTSLNRSYKRQQGNLKSLSREIGIAAKSSSHFERAERKVQAQVGKTTAALGVQRKKLESRNRLLKGGARFAGAAVGAAALGAVSGGRKVIDFDADLTQLAIDSNVGADKQASIKEQILGLTDRPDIKVTREQLLEAVKEITARTGNVDIGVNNLESVAKTISATGAQGTDVGSLVSNFVQKFQINDPKEIAETLEAYAALGKEGAFELRDLATQMNRVSAAFGNTQRVGKGAAIEMAALLQVVKDGAASTDSAATNFEKLINTLVIDKAADLKDAGIPVIGQGGVSRPIADVINDILDRTNNDPQLLKKVFPEERAFRGAIAFANARRTLQNGGDAIDINELSKIDGSGNQLSIDSARNASTAAGTVTRIGNRAYNLADDSLSSALSSTAKVETKLSEGNWLDALGEYAKGLNDLVERLGPVGLGSAIVRVVVEDDRIRLSPTETSGIDIEAEIAAGVTQ